MGRLFAVASVCAATGLGVAGCAHAPRADVPAPPVNNLMSVPTLEGAPIAPTGLVHVMRGQFFLHTGRPAAAIPHLRLALVYDPSSSYVHERLTAAWLLSGDEKRARSALAAGLLVAPDDPALNSLSGRLAVRRGEYELGVAHLRKAVADASTMLGAGPALIDGLAWLGRDKEAIAQARLLMERAPSDADLALGVGAYLEDHELLRESLEAYRRARLQRPSDRLAAMSEVRVLDLLGQLSQAADRLVPLFAFFPDALELYVELARRLRRAGSPDAEAYRDEALRQASGRVDGVVTIALSDAAEGRLEQARELLEQLLAKQPDAPAGRLALAEVATRAGDVAGCRRGVQNVEAPSIRMWGMAATCAELAGDSQGVLEALGRAVDLGYEVGHAIMDAARFLAHTETDEAAAQSVLAAFADTLDEPPEPQLSLASIHLAVAFGHEEQALERLVELEHAQPEDVYVVLRLADVQARMGDVDAAVERLSQFLIEDPGDLARLNALGFTLADGNQRLDEAAVWLRRAYRMSPDDGYIVDSLGWLLFRQGRFVAALHLLERADLMNPNDPEILRHVGDARRALGDRAGAAKAYGAALRCRPEAKLQQLLHNRLKGPEVGA